MTNHHFTGNPEGNVPSSFVIDTDRSLDEGPGVLTARCLNPSEAFMGWIYGGSEATFVEVPARLAGAFADIIATQLEDEDGMAEWHLTEDDRNDVASFVGALVRAYRASLTDKEN